MDLRLFLLPLLLLLTPSFISARKIPLPPDVQAEGTTHAQGSNYFASDLRSGAVFLVDISTGLITTAVPPAPNRAAVGLTFTGKRLFVSGGSGRGADGMARMYVYDSVFGTTVASCAAMPAGFVNDVITDRRFAYYTDSFAGVLYRLRLSKLPACDVETIRLPRPAFGAEAGVFKANGIVKFRGGLLVGNSALATVFFIDLLNENKAQRVLPVGSIPGTDGYVLALRGRRAFFYVTQNREGLVSEWRLRMKRRSVSAMFLRNITSDAFDYPTTIALNGDTLVAANARFDAASPGAPIPEGVVFSLGVTNI